MSQVKTSVFTPDEVTLILSERHNPDSFYRTRSGLWVSEEFRRLVVAIAKPTEAGMNFTPKPRTLGREATDKEIEEELEELLGTSKHLFDETEVSAVVARLITGQARGESGPLLNNGDANLFYLLSCVVHVHWLTVLRRWNVFTWERGGLRWHAGARVFSPAN